MEGRNPSPKPPRSPWNAEAFVWIRSLFCFSNAHFDLCPLCFAWATICFISALRGSFEGGTSSAATFLKDKWYIMSRQWSCFSNILRICSLRSQDLTAQKIFSLSPLFRGQDVWAGQPLSLPGSSIIMETYRDRTVPLTFAEDLMTPGHVCVPDEVPEGLLLDSKCARLGKDPWHSVWPPGRRPLFFLFLRRVLQRTSDFNPW